MQHEGQGDELAIAMTNKDEEDAKIVWILSDSYNKNKWVQGRVDIRPPDDPNLEYRVCAKVFFIAFSLMQLQQSAISPFSSDYCFGS